VSTYSYGNARSTSAWPTGDEQTAHNYAKALSTSGDTWLVHEYPPGPPQPGRLIATYRNGELVQEVQA
jgi:hypothetical protein